MYNILSDVDRAIAIRMFEIVMLPGVAGGGRCSQLGRVRNVR